MKAKYGRVCLLLLYCCLQLCAATARNPALSPTNQHFNSDSMRIKITIGKTLFYARLQQNPAAKAFAAKLPLTLSMEELNGNEKYAALPNRLPANARIPAVINKGDLLLYGANTLVIFYQSFTTSYSYTPIGQLENTDGLAAALGNGDVSVTFAQE